MFGYLSELRPKASLRRLSRRKPPKGSASLHAVSLLAQKSKRLFKDYAGFGKIHLLRFYV